MSGSVQVLKRKGPEDSRVVKLGVRASCKAFGGGKEDREYLT